MTASADPSPTLLATGAALLGAMLAAIEQSQRSVRLEFYICTDCQISRRFRTALVDAQRRGVKVSVLLDAFGSLGLADDFWQELTEAGGSFRLFNPLGLGTIASRNHRKLVVCDDDLAFVGGCNLSEEYDGDGITHGWRDLGLSIRGAIARELAASFDVLFSEAGERQTLWRQIRQPRVEASLRAGTTMVLLNSPSFGAHLINRALSADLRQARSVQIMAGYFLPTRRLRHRLVHLAQNGARVQLLLAGRSDVAIAQWAGRHLYDRFLRAGCEIYEYQPQVLHAKMVIVDDVVYAGSCNLDLRSLNFNYELMVCVADRALATSARELFARDLEHSRKIERRHWRLERTWWGRLLERLSHLLLSRLDPLIARSQMRKLR